MEEDELEVRHDLTTALTDYPSVSPSDNSSLNLTDSPQLDDLDLELFQGYSTALLRFASACCVLFMLVGIPGNLITIIALFRCKKVGSVAYVINKNIDPCLKMWGILA